MDIKLVGDIHYLSGKLDEHADLSLLGKAPSPLRLNLRGIKSINSNGVRKFLAFVLAASSDTLEFHECPPEFISNVNVIPQILGQPPNALRIKSLFVPLSCEDCDKSEDHLISLTDLKMAGDGIWCIPTVACPRCGSAMVLDVDPGDYFVFMEDIAG